MLHLLLHRITLGTFVEGPSDLVLPHLLPHRPTFCGHQGNRLLTHSGGRDILYNA